MYYFLKCYESNFSTKGFREDDKLEVSILTVVQKHRGKLLIPI